jgi:hypothetical protein
VLFAGAEISEICSEENKIWPDKWILHPDKAPVHDALGVHEFLANISIKSRPST